MSDPRPLNIEAGPAWYPDPTGRFPLRWWDGRAWSSDVHGPSGHSYDPLAGASGASDSSGGNVGPVVGFLAASLLPTALAGLLSGLAIATALSNPVEGMATISFWFMSVLFSIAAGVLAITALAVASDRALARRARRTVFGLGIGVIAVNFALVVAPLLGTVVDGAFG